MGRGVSAPCSPGWPQTPLLPVKASTGITDQLGSQITGACHHANLQQQTFNLSHSLLFCSLSLPPTLPSPWLNLKSKHQTTAPHTSHLVALACLPSDHSHGDQADVTVSVERQAPPPPSTRSALRHCTTLSQVQGHVGQGPRQLRGIYFLLNNESPSQV